MLVLLLEEQELLLMAARPNFGIEVPVPLVRFPPASFSRHCNQALLSAGVNSMLGWGFLGFVL